MFLELIRENLAMRKYTILRYEMKAGSFIDKRAEFQTNWLMDVKSAQQLVRLVPGGRGTLNVVMESSFKNNRCNVKTNPNT